MKNLNSSSLADFCYTGGNCHQAGDEGREEEGREEEGRGGKGEGKRGRERKREDVLTRNGLRQLTKLLILCKFSLMLKTTNPQSGMRV